jgi:hypothetical protein
MLAKIDYVWYVPLRNAHAPFARIKTEGMRHVSAIERICRSRMAAAGI